MSKIDLYNGDCSEVMDKLIEEGIKVDAIIMIKDQNVMFVDVIEMSQFKIGDWIWTLQKNLDFEDRIRLVNINELNASTIVKNLADKEGIEDVKFSEYVKNKAVVHNFDEFKKVVEEFNKPKLKERNYNYVHILFRAKNSHTGKWEYSECISTELDDGKLFFHYGGEIEWIEVDEYTLGQYTGLDDKNGNKIFEDDFVVLEGEYGDWFPKKVIYGNDYGVCAYTLANTDYILNKSFVGLDNIRLVGNTFDNPELK